MLQKCIIVCAGLLALCSPVLVSAETVSFTDDLTGFSSGISEFTSGGDQGQVITASTGTTGPAPAIDGQSIFTIIDTTGVNPDPAVSGSYGGGIQTDIVNAFDAGDLTSSDPADYNVVFDVAANGFAPNNVDIFLQFRNQFNDNQLGAQLSINQNSPALSPFLTTLGGTDDPVSVSIPLSAFTGTPADVSGLATSDRIQFQYFTRSLDSNYSDDAGNVLVLDNIGVTLETAVVPEPASATIMVVGALCIATRRRRKA